MSRSTVHRPAVTPSRLKAAWTFLGRRPQVGLVNGLDVLDQRGIPDGTADGGLIFAA